MKTGVNSGNHQKDNFSYLKYLNYNCHVEEKRTTYVYKNLFIFLLITNNFAVFCWRIFFSFNVPNYNEFQWANNNKKFNNSSFSGKNNGVIKWKKKILCNGKMISHKISNYFRLIKNEKSYFSRTQLPAWPTLSTVSFEKNYTSFILTLTLSTSEIGLRKNTHNLRHFRQRK